MERFWHAFIPLFVAFDGVGLLPMFWAMTQRLSPVQRQRAVTEAVLTAFLVAVGFLLVIRKVFELLGLTFADLMVAGGAILFVLSLRDLLLPDKPPRHHSTSPGVVPLGVPLLAGPAVLTAMLLVRDRYGWSVALLALLANLAVVWLVLRSSEWLMQRLGRDGAQVISKIFSLILTAFGVMLIRQGITMFLQPSS
jgi:multiple antibiotic resistance protein